MQSCPGLCKTVRRTCKWLYMCARKRACMHWTYVLCSMNYSCINDCSDTQRPNICHVIHNMHSACKKNHMANVFRRPWVFNLLQGRFCTGADTTAYANVSGRTQNALCSSVRADTIAYAKPSGGHYCIWNNVLRIVLHRWHNCMRHLTNFFAKQTLSVAQQWKRNILFLLTWFM